MPYPAFGNILIRDKQMRETVSCDMCSAVAGRRIMQKRTMLQSDGIKIQFRREADGHVIGYFFFAAVK